MINLTEVQHKGTKNSVKNLTNAKFLNFAFGGKNKVYTPQKHCTNNTEIDLNQLIELIKSDAPNNALKVREIVKNGFDNNISSKEIKKQIKPFKNALPFVLLSGFCPIHHNDKTLLYNSFIQIDIDFKFKDGDLKAIALKEIVKQLPFVVFAAISPSGFGLKLLVSTNNYDIDLHGKVSKALINDLSERLNIDKIYFDKLGASQPCFVPFDKDVYYNENYTQYNAFKALYKLEQQQRKEVEKQLLEERSKPRTYNFDSDNIETPTIEILKYLTTQLTISNIDITDTWESWGKVACCYASCGENARSLFHSVASLNSTYDYRENEKRFDSAKKANFNGIGYLVERCKSYNITINSFCSDWIKEHSKNNNVYRVFSDAKDYKNESITHHYNLDKNQFIGNILKDFNFDIGLHLIKAGTGAGKTTCVSNAYKEDYNKAFEKTIVVSRNVTTLENYNKYGFTQYLFSENNNDKNEIEANGINKITVTYKSFKKLRENINLTGYTIVFDEAHLLNESYKDVKQETKYAYNTINDLVVTNCIILMSANDIHFNAKKVEYKSKHYFVKHSVQRDLLVTYNSSFDNLKSTITKRVEAGKKILLFTNRTECKYISECIKIAFPNHSKYFFDSTKHGKIDLENLQYDITIVTSALVTGKDVLNENLGIVFYGLDIAISASTIVQFFGRARNYKTATFDLLFEFKNDNETYGSYSYSGLISACYGIAQSTISASVNDWSFLRENKDRFVTKHDGKLVVDWFNIDNYVQRQISKHTVLNTDVLSKFLKGHGYNATIEILDDIEQEKQDNIEVVSISELYDLELNEIDANNEHETEFLTNVFNRFDALMKIGFARNTSLDICNSFKSKMMFKRFIDLLIVEKSLTTNDKVFIELYNDVLNVLNQFYTAQQIVENLQTLKVSKAANKTQLGIIVKRSKMIKKNDTKKVRFLVKILKSYYDFEQKRSGKTNLYQFVKSDYLQGLQVSIKDVKTLFEYLELTK